MTAPGDDNEIGGSFDAMAGRLRLTFRVAVWTNVVAVVLLVASVAGATVLMVLGEPSGAAIAGSVGVIDLIYGIAEKPWRQLWTATNRIALTETVWLTYIEGRRTVESTSLDERQRSLLLTIQGQWLNRMAIIGQEDFGRAVDQLLVMDNASDFTTVEMVRWAAESSAMEGEVSIDAVFDD